MYFCTGLEHTHLVRRDFFTGPEQVVGPGEVRENVNPHGGFLADPEGCGHAERKMCLESTSVALPEAPRAPRALGLPGQVAPMNNCVVQK